MPLFKLGKMFTYACPYYYWPIAEFGSASWLRICLRLCFFIANWLLKMSGGFLILTVEVCVSLNAVPSVSC